MKYLLLTFLIITPLSLGAVTGEDVRFDWVLGEPAVTVDSTSACNDTAVARFDWVLGQPSVVFDATATCTSVVPFAEEVVAEIIWFITN